jgi:predicted MFS family arabinose efflux permease
MNQVAAVAQEFERTDNLVRDRILCGLAVALYWAALYLYMGTLPTYVESKAQGDLAIVGVVLSMYGLWQAIFRLPLGIISDWLGKRKVFVIVGFFLAGLGAVVMGQSAAIGGVMVGRILTGIAAATWVPLVVTFSSLFKAEEAVHATLILSLAGSLSRVLATAVTGSLNLLGGYALSFWLAGLMAVLAIVVFLFIKEPARERKQPSWGNVTKLITRPVVLLPAVLALLVLYAVWASIYGFNPKLATELGADGRALSLLVSLNSVAVAVGTLGATAIAKKVGAGNLIYLGFVLLAGGVAAAALAPGLWLLFVAQMVIGLAQGVGSPILMGLSIRYVDDSQRATAMGLHQTVYAFGMFGGPAISGALAQWLGIRPMLGITAGAVLLLGILLMRSFDHHVPDERHEQAESAA